MSTTYKPGTYEAEIIGQGFEQSAIKRTPCFYLQFRVCAHLDAQGQLQDCPKFERFYRQYLANDTGFAILRADLSTLGVSITDLRELDPSSENHISLVGRTLQMSCEHEAYNGQLRERWSLRRRRKKLDLDSLQQLSTKFKHILGGNSEQPNPPAPPTTHDD